jgi:hypothetical protein
MRFGQAEERVVLARGRLARRLNDPSFDRRKGIGGDARCRLAQPVSGDRGLRTCGEHRCIS